MFPLLPVLGNQVIGVAAISYAGQFNIMVTANRGACPDLDLFAACLRDDMDALTASRRAA